MRALSSNPSRRKERGASILIFTLMIWLVAIPMVGICIDGAIVFFAQQRLAAAVDAAALAGGRAFTADVSATQTTSINATVTRYFKANFPDGFLGTKNTSLPAAEVLENSTKVRTVRVKASADVSLYFMPLLGYGVSRINAVAQTSRRNMNIVMVLDRSGSMTSASCANMKTSAQNFSDSFSDGNDALGVVTFVASANADYLSTKYFKSGSPTLRAAINSLGCKGSTNSSAALMKGWEQLQRTSQVGMLDVLIFFTDGFPHGFTGAFRFNSTSACQSLATNANGYVAPDPTKYDDNTKFVYGVTTSKSGIGKDIAMPINTGDDPGALSVSGCSVASLQDVKNNFDGYPLKDWYGLPTDKYASARAFDASVSSSLFDVYRTYAGNGKLALTGTTNTARDNAWIASKSTAYYAAQKIRQAGVRVYAIGLQSNGGVDDNYLRQLANDPLSDEYTTLEPQGRYAAAADPGQIAAAFNSIKSELLRLSQ